MLKTFAKLWVLSSCRFAMPPADAIKQSDPQARAWMFLGGDMHEGVGQSHVDIARNGLTSGSFGPHHIKDLTGDPPMGRATSDGKTMGLWFGSDKAFSPPFSTAILQSADAGMLAPDGVLLFLDGKKMSLSDYLGLVNNPMTPAAAPGSPALL